jgi:Asp-tRNA(Asn)/Glu-tRNA(Gln) amidotransferase A subunit family amidase
MDFRTTTVAQLAADVAAKQVSSRELVQAALERIESLNPAVNAFVVVDGDAALRAAAAIDERIARGEQVGALGGIPIGVKDLEDAAGLPTSQGSAVYADGPPAATDSALVARLRAAGCVVVGKTNSPEMGWKGDTVNPRFGATANPWDLTRSAGGSSGGSGAALAAGMVPLCTGSDGGGSIRIPASVNGLSGMKPSLGRVPIGDRTPPGWADLSTRGPMARTIRDTALALDCSVGPEPTDLRSLPMPDASWTRSLEQLGAPLRIGWSPTLGYAKVDREVRALCEAALGQLAGLGTEVVEIDTVFPQDPVRSWLTLTTTSDLRRIAHLEGTPDWDRLDPGHVAMIEAFGRPTTALEYLEAEDECHRMNARLVDVFHEVPLLCTPTVGGQVGPIDGQGTIDGETTPFWISCTYPFNMTRSPAGTVCVGLTESGLPVGLQVVGPQHGDVAVLRALALLEDAIGFDQLAPI